MIKRPTSWQIIASVFVISTAVFAGIISHQIFASRSRATYSERMRLFGELRGSAVDAFMKSKRSEALFWSERPLVRESLTEFLQAWKEMGPDASQLVRTAYIDGNPHPENRRDLLDAADDNSSYTKAHRSIHPRIRRFIKMLGYYDVFLIDPDGNVVYTAYKETDFATNLVNGPWRGTGIGRAFRRVVKDEEGRKIVFEDFSRYGPSADQAAAFIAVLVLDDVGKRLGVLAFQIPIDQINRIMHVTEGMGESGETYLVRNDFQMLTQSRFRNESTVLVQRVDTPTASRALAGEQGVDFVDDYRGVPVLSAFSMVSFEGTKWASIAEIDKSEVMEGVVPLALLIAGLAAILAGGIVMTLRFAILIRRHMQAFDVVAAS